MKYFVILLILIGFSGSFLFDNYAYGMWMPLSPEDLMEQSKTIFVGTITAVNLVDVEYQSQIARNGTIKENVGPEIMTLEEYTVDVEEFLKNPQDSDTMKVLRATVSGVPSGPAKISGFEIGDRVLFYLPKDEKQTHFSGQYLPESFKIPKQCVAKTVLELPRIDGRNRFSIVQEGIQREDNFTANVPIQFSYDRDVETLSGHSFNVSVGINKVTDNSIENGFQKIIQVNSEPCKWISSAKWDFVPQSGEYRMAVHISEEGSGSGFSRSFYVIENTDFKYPTPGSTIISDLYPIKKQFEAGLRYEELSCNEGFVLITKYDGTPACVKPSTIEKLVERKWAKPIPSMFRDEPNIVDSPTTPIDQLFSTTIKPDIVNIESDKYVHLSPTGMCATVQVKRVSQDYMDERQSFSEQERKFVEVDEEDFASVPKLKELIVATHAIDPPKNDFAQTELGMQEFVNYEMFLMQKAIEKYGDTKEDYFVKLDENLEDKLANPQKEGFSNEFLAPQIVYKDNVYALGHTVFWVADEHEPHVLSLSIQNEIDDKKFIDLTEEDMKSIPLIKNTIEKIGMQTEYVIAFKGFDEPEWDEYRHWYLEFEKRFAEDEKFAGIVYKNEYYEIGFPIC